MVNQCFCYSVALPKLLIIGSVHLVSVYRLIQDLFRIYLVHTIKIMGFLIKIPGKLYLEM